MSFVPPVFSDFGKKGKDLFSKKYNFGNSLVVKHKKAGKCNLVLESKANFGSCGVGGATKVTCENTDRKIEVTGSTCGTLSASVEQKNVAQGVTVKVCGGCDGPCGTSSCADKKACADQKDSKCSASSCLAALNGEARVEYRREYVAATAGLSTKKGNVSLCGSGVAGSNGVSVGGRFSVDLASQELKCYGVGAQYETSDCVVALTTAKLNSYSLSAYHTVDRDTTIGFQFDHNSKCNKSPRVLWAAIEHAAAPDTTVKAKASSAGCGALAVEHRVGNPNVQLGFSAGFNFANASGNLGQALSPDKFGVQLTLGEF